ncbi:MAG: S-layer homology domain-containing protein [Clostridia bacterium]|nr:S-layer homology domain-containing protein [Clostridia bacterium]
MKIKNIVSLLLASVMTVSSFAVVSADETKLYSETVDMTNVKADKEDGVVKEFEVPDGDYEVTVTTGGDTETKANVYINGGERVRAYTLEAGKEQENVQRVVPLDGKITVKVIGENPNVTEIEVVQLPDRKEKGEKTTIYIAGDSTAQTYDYTKNYPQTGWGQMFGAYFTDEVVIENRSMAGRSLKSYNNDGRLDKILTEMHPGDYVFVQFGINDGAVNKPERYISVEDYKKLMTEKYIGEVVKRGGIPVILTASAAGWYDDAESRFVESRQDYAVPTAEVAEETGCAFIDINKIMTDAWNAMDKEEVLSGYFVCEMLESKAYPTGTNDTTHMKPKGAKVVAGMVADAIKTEIPELAQYLKGDAVFTDIAGHWGETYIKALADKGLVDGVGDGKFNPDGTVTRAEFLKMAMDAAEIPGHAYRDGECLDATTDDWYCYYLQGALDKGLIFSKSLIEDCEYEYVNKVLAEATEDKEAIRLNLNIYTGKFNGGTPITREEMAFILDNCFSYRMREMTLKEMKESVAPTDLVISSIPEYNVVTNVMDLKDYNTINAEYRGSVDDMYIKGLISGMGDGTFAPKATLTRAQAAVVINKLANLLK